jgi:hypothetical protein
LKQNKKELFNEKDNKIRWLVVPTQCDISIISGIANTDASGIVSA